MLKKLDVSICNFSLVDETFLSVSRTRLRLQVVHRESQNTIVGLPVTVYVGKFC